MENLPINKRELKCWCFIQAVKSILVTMPFIGDKGRSDKHNKEQWKVIVERANELYNWCSK